MMDRKMVNFIREQYPPGTRIRLNSMEDPYAPILPGTEGEVDFEDDAGQLHMKWDNGRSLALIPGELISMSGSRTAISTTAAHCWRAVSCAAIRIRSRRRW